jgi:hypothetical protein
MNHNDKLTAIVPSRNAKSIVGQPAAALSTATAWSCASRTANSVTVAIVPASAVQPSRRASTGGRSSSHPVSAACTPRANSTAPWGHSPSLAVKNTLEFQGHTCQTTKEATAIARVAAASRTPGRAP